MRVGLVASQCEVTPAAPTVSAQMHGVRTACLTQVHGTQILALRCPCVAPSGPEVGRADA